MPTFLGVAHRAVSSYQKRIENLRVVRQCLCSDAKTRRQSKLAKKPSSYAVNGRSVIESRSTA